MDLGLKDKVAIITGSSRGLGLAAAQALAREGCRVTICARAPEQLAKARALVETDSAAGRVLAQPADVSTETGIQSVIDATVRTFGGVDILVNNVGTAGGGGLLETSDDDWHAAFDQTLFPAI